VDLRVTRYQDASVLDSIGAKGDGGGGNNWSYDMQSSSQTNTQFFYRPDALPVSNQQLKSLKGFIIHYL